MEPGTRDAGRTRVVAIASGHRTGDLRYVARPHPAETETRSPAMHSSPACRSPVCPHAIGAPPGLAATRGLVVPRELAPAHAPAVTPVGAVARVVCRGAAVSTLSLALLAGGGSVRAASPEPGPVLVPGPFPERSLSRWQERSFEGDTDYRLVREDGVQVLRGRTDGTASLLYRERRIDLERTPVLQWSWKVDRVYTMIDERTRGGDDFPARLYVVARTGLLPWQTLAINYVWAAEARPGDSWPNPFTDKATMIAVRSGTAEVGRWVRQRRDVAADFRAAFGKQVDDIDGYAVMVDGDNGQRQATAWFGDLEFLPRDEPMH